MGHNYLSTGQAICFDAVGNQIPCAGTGQDGTFGAGIWPPMPRFEPEGLVVHDRLTGLFWPRNATMAEVPMTWAEALSHVREMNSAKALGFDDWRMPNRIEHASLVCFGAARPVLPHDAPFENLQQTWYWTSTTAAISPAHAWIEMSGGRMFNGRKSQFFLLWPVRGEGASVLRKSGQTRCFNGAGAVQTCAGSGQDAETQTGRAWPAPRFEDGATAVRDRLTGLRWQKRACLTEAGVGWADAMKAVAELNEHEAGDWRVPNINELESLVDCASHTPALPAGHRFDGLRDVSWSSTTSPYEPGWSFALYLDKGAIGAGHKRAAHFHVWPVCG